MIEISSIKSQTGFRRKRIAKYVLSGRLKNMIDVINRDTVKYGITGARYNIFMACCSLDSRYFKIFDVNDMIWSVPWMARTFTGLINSGNYDYYQSRRDELLNRFYKDFNGNQVQGDGWKYRDRGIIKIRGRNAYDELSYHLLGSSELLENPDKLTSTPELMVKAACIWFNLHLNLDDNGKICKLLSVPETITNFNEIIRFYEKSQEKSDPDSDDII